MAFEVYATRWDSPGIVSQLIPARGITFSMPILDHGEASFTASTEPGRSFWRASLGGPRSGVLIAETQDAGPARPLWDGRLKNEQQQAGTRSFQFSCAEWGSALGWFPAPVDRWDNTRDTDILTDILTRVQAVAGQNLQIGLDITPGAAFSDFEVKAWDVTSAEQALVELSNAAGGPEWYVTVGGTLNAPVRQLVAADRVGLTEARTVLEFVEDTEDPTDPMESPDQVLLARLFPGRPPVLLSGREGGNVLACGRSQDSENAATVVVAVGAGQDETQIRATAVAQDLLDAGFPRITKVLDFSNVSNPETLQRHADAELTARRGALTEYSLVTRGSRPEWRKVARGSTVRVSLDTDVFGARRPLEFEARVHNATVTAPDDGGEEMVRWDVSSVLEVGS